MKDDKDLRAKAKENGGKRSKIKEKQQS